MFLIKKYYDKIEIYIEFTYYMTFPPDFLFCFSRETLY